LEILGAGGMGVVFRAEDPRLKRQVALKVILPHLLTGDLVRRRFLREAQGAVAAATIENDHIVTIYEVGEDRGIPFLAMQFLKGESLAKCLERERTLPIDEVLRIGRETAQGLAAAHQHGLIHRDIKPANLWLEGGIGRVKILDFGLVRVAEDDGLRTQLTQQGVIVGTPAYMAPEQANGQTVDARADLFSLGCVLYRMATGEPAFQGPDAVATLLAVVSDNPRSPRERNPHIPAELSDLIVRLMAKEPSRRPPTAIEVADTLRRLEKKSPDTTQAAARTARRGRRLAPIYAGAVAILLACLGIVWFVLGRTSEVANPTPKNVAKPAGFSAGTPTLVLQPAPLPGVRQWTLEPRGHRGAARRGAFSPDGKLLASGGSDATVRLWDAHTGKLLRVLMGHEQEISALAWSRDGTRLASGDVAGAVRLWDTASGNCLHTLSGHAGTIHSLNFSDDGLGLASASADQSVRLWDVLTGKQTHELPGHGAPVRFVYWRPGGRTLVSGSSANGKCCLWDAKTGHLLKSRVSRAPWAWSAGYSTLAFKAEKTTVGFWEPDTDLVTQLPLKELTEGFFSLAWSPDGKTLATGTGSDKWGEFQVWDARSGDLIHRAKGAHLSRCDELVFSSDGARLLSLGRFDFFALVWDVPTWKVFRRLTRGFHIDGGTLSPDGTRALIHVHGERLAPGARQTFDVWDLASQTPWRIPLSRADSEWVAWSPDGKFLACMTVFNKQWSHSSAQVRLWETATGRLLQILPLEQKTQVTNSYPLAWSPDGQILATSGDGFSVQLWDPYRAKPLRKLTDKHTGWVQALGISPDGKLLISFADEGWLWDLTTGQTLRPLTGLPNPPAKNPMGNVDQLAWSPDGKTLATCNTTWYGVDLWDIPSGKHRQRLEGHKDRVVKLAWSPDGQTLASGSPDRAVFLWKSNGKKLAELRDDRQGILGGLSWLDNKTLATISGTGRLCVWDVAREQVRHSTLLPGVRYGSFSPDGKLLASRKDLAGTRLFETVTGHPVGTLFGPAQTGRIPSPKEFVTLSADGHSHAEPPGLLEREFVYVIRTDRGLEIASPGAFALEHREFDGNSSKPFVSK
jgi:WD40 repeat protein